MKHTHQYRTESWKCSRMKHTFTSVNTQNKDILVERNAAYQTVVCPQKDEGDYEVIT